jgi:hypothetical protein
MFWKALEFAQDRLSKATEGSASYQLLSLVFLVATWLSWYTWRFGISPALNSREPKQIPYWMPGALKFRPLIPFSKANL